MKWGYQSVPPLGGPRGTSEFSEECLLFVPGVSVSALSFTFRLLPGPMASVPAAHLLSHGRCPSSASLSSAWMLSTMLFLFLLLTWPLPTSPSCCRWVTLKLPTPHGFPPGTESCTSCLLPAFSALVLTVFYDEPRASHTKESPFPPQKYVFPMRDYGL